MAKGWIKLHRQITENFLWGEEPFTKAQAWIDILLMVNHEDNVINIDGKPRTICAGEKHTSLVKLANRWKWDRRKVLRFLKSLSWNGMLSFDSTSNGTTITVTNWALYQSDGTANGTYNGTSDGTSHGTQTRMIKNDKERGEYTPPKRDITVEDLIAYRKANKLGEFKDG